MTRKTDSGPGGCSCLNGHDMPRACAALLSAALLLGLSSGLAAADPRPAPLSTVVTCAPGDVNCLILTGILGTSGNDVIPVTVPLLTEAIVGPSGSDNVQAMATGVDGNGGHDNVLVSAGATTTAEASLDDQYLIGEAGSTAVARGIVARTGQDTILNLSGIVSTSRAVTDVNQLFTPGQTYLASGMPVNSASHAVGIDGGGGLDDVANRGSIVAAAFDNTNASKERFEVLALPVTAGLWDATTGATATATGISGGAYGAGASGAVRSLANFDNVTARAEANASLWDWKVEGVGGARLDGSTNAFATAAGLDGGERASALSNAGRLDVDAISDASLVSIELKWKGLGIKGIFGLFDNTAKFVTLGESKAFGLRGGAGDDLISNDAGPGPVDVHSKATATSTTVNVALGFMPGKSAPPPAAGAAVAGLASPLFEAPGQIGGGERETQVDTGTRARSAASGISAGGGADFVSNASLLKSRAESFATSVTVDVDLSFSPSPGGLNWFPLPSMAVSESKTEADAFATGIDGGAGDDNVVNTARIETTSWAEADSTSVGVVFKGQPNGIAAALNMSDTTTVAVAGATGISGGAGGDTIGNLSEIAPTATAESDSIAVKLNASGQTGGAIVGGMVINKSDTSARSSAAGIDGGAGAGAGAPDSITNTWYSGSYAIDALADSDATATSVSVEFVGAVGEGGTGLVVAGTYSRARTTADAYGLGILSGDGGSRVENRGDVRANGIADATSTRVDVKVSGAAQGVVLGAVLSDTTTECRAEGAGIAGGAGADVVENYSGIEALSSATSETIGVTVDASGTLKGIGVEAVLSKSDTNSTAASAGISGGAGTDNIVNAGTVHAKATSTDEVTDVGVSVHGSIEGITIGAMLSSSGINSTADAFGIEGGGGDDNVVNRNSVLSEATADGTLRSWKFDLGVSKNVAIEVVVADTNNVADATAVGIAGGAGNDALANDDQVTANATSTPSTLGISVAMAGAPLSMAANLAWAETVGNATSFGLDGGAGNDRIENRSGIAGLASAETTTDAVSANLGMLNVAFVDAASTATGLFTGIGGGAGSDNVFNEGRIGVEARSDAGSLAVAGALGLFGFVQGDVTSTARSFATGIDGDASHDPAGAGAGDDEIVNLGTIAPLANATANGRSVSGQLLGISFSNGTTTAEATAAGIAGGAGADTLRNEGYAGAASNATGNGWAVSGSVLGWNRTDLDTYANAYATGLSGGDGDDAIENSGTDNAVATSTASGHAVAGTVLGITDGRSGTYADARAAGIDGGDGRDLIRNGGVLLSTADTTANGLNISAAVLGWEMVHPILGSDAAAVGIDGGAGDDVIFSGVLEGHAGQPVSIQARARAKTDGRDVAANVAGFADVGETSLDEGGLFAEAIGIDGGAGSDAILNEGAIAASADGDATQASLSISAIGFARSRSAAGPSVSAIGIEGGDGHDNVVNLGSILAGFLPSGRTALATVGTRPDGKLDVTEAGTGIGYALADAALGAFASAAGMTGGAGNDILENHGVIEVGFLDNAAAPGTKTAMAMVKSANYSIAILGKADVESVVGATADSVGMDGGEGADRVANGAAGAVTVRASADSYSKDTSASGIVSSTDSQVSATARADGLRGGGGDDTIVNDADASDAGSVHVEAKAVVEGDGGSGSGFFADGEVVTEARATAVGIRGDAEPPAAGTATPAPGSDNVVNRGTVAAVAVAESYSRPDAYAVFLHAAAKGEARSYATAAAVDAGDGGNVVVNSGELRAEATAGARLYASVDTDISSTEANLYAYGAARADGIAAGDGGNRVVQTASGSIEAVARVRTADAAGNMADGYADEDATVVAAGWNGSWTLPISAVATGVSLGSGDDLVTVAGTVSASATASGAVKARSNSTPYTASATAKGYVRAAAAGIDAGAGSNVVRNEGRIDADAVAWGNPVARSYSFFKTASSDASAYVTAESAGILGNGWLQNAPTGIVDVTSHANSFADADTDTESTNATAVLTAHSTGMGTKPGAAGLQTIRNDGVLSVSAFGGEASGIGWPVPGPAHTSTDLHVRANKAITTTTIDIEAAGIRAEHGVNDIVNAGHIEATGYARNHVWAIADDYWETATAEAIPTADSAAHGIVALGGTNRVANFGWIDARATATDVWGRGFTDGLHANCYSTATVNGHGEAYGINLLGGGNNTVVNSSLVSAYAHADARAEAWADTGWFDDEYETASATATATAVGIHAESGANEVRNEGTLTVRATASASAATYGGIGSHSSYAGATAAGILADNGANTLRNTGTIDVLSAAAAGTRSVQAVGIRGGSGNDFIENEGYILAGTFADPAVVENLVSTRKAGDPTAAGFTAGIGIDAGDGDDWVALSGSSRVVGSVLLGAGDDTLELSGSPTVTGTMDAGTGMNTMWLSGAGSFDREPGSIRRVVKDGSGTFTLPALAGPRAYTMLEGTLEVGSLGSMDDASVFEALVQPDGTHGLLRVSNDGVQLDGRLTVLRTDGVYLSSRSVILEAPSLSGTFDLVELPPSGALLRFGYEQAGNQAVVTVEADPFVSAALNGAELAVARHLDAIAATVSGDLADRLASMQLLAAPDFAGAFSSLSPESYNAGTASVVDLGAARLRNLQARMSSVRLSNGTGTPTGGRAAGIRVASAAQVPGAGIMPAPATRRPYDAWLSGYSQSGDRDADSGFTGFSFRTVASALGVDRVIGERLWLGAGVEWANADLELDDGRGEADIGSTAGFLYGTWAGRRGFLEGAFTLGRESFANSRLVTGGAGDFIATSFHDARSLSGLLGGGCRVPVGDWSLAPRADLWYVRLKEDGVRESGADNSVLIVSGRTTESLVADLGLRASRPFRFTTGFLVPEIGLAWRHDFAIGNRRIVAAFAGAPGATFAVDAPDATQDWMSADGGVAFTSDDGFTAALKYLGEFRSGARTDALFGELRVSF